MNKYIKFFFLFLFFSFSTHCSFNKNSNFWSGVEDDKKRIQEIEAWQLSENDEFFRIYSTKNYFEEEIALSKKVILTNPKKNLSWKTSGLNNQNYVGHIYLDNINNNFLKKKFGKNKFNISNLISSPIVFNNNIIFTDDTGSIFNVNLDGKLNWKKNIYKKVYKNIYKNLSLSVSDGIIYISDNIGFIYAITLDAGEPVWFKNYGNPLKSRIKIFNDKIFLVDQSNRILCFDTKNGTKIWDVRTAQSFIKSQYFLALAISNSGSLVTINSRGDLLKIDTKYGKVIWSLNVADTKLAQDIDFFKSSDIVITDNSIIFSTSSETFSLNLQNGYTNWKQNVGSNNTPIVDGDNIFLVTNNGFLVNLDKKSGKIIYSSNVLKILDRKGRKTKVIGYILGSEKIYSLTSNGHIIITSATLGNSLNFKKIGKFKKNNANTNPIISNGSLYILTENQKILGFN